MRAKTISFERGKDPKKIMNIGGVKNRAKLAVRTADPIEIEKFISDFDQDFGAATELYLPEDKQEELYWTVKFLGKKNIKVKDFDPDDDSRLPEKYRNIFSGLTRDDSMEYLFKRIIQPWIDKGWEIFWEEDNISIVQYILVKY